MTTPMTPQPAPASLIDFSRTISAFNKAGQCREALTYFRTHHQLFSRADIAANVYVVSGVLQALKGSQRPQAMQEGLQFLVWAGINLGEQTPESIQTALAWLMYRHLKGQVQDKSYTLHDDEHEELVTVHEPSTPTDAWQKAALILLPLLQKGTSEYTINAFSYLFGALLKAEKQTNNPNWQWMAEICDVVNPCSLSKTCNVIEIQQKGRTKQMELASDLEIYYAYKSKALLKQGKIKECLATVQEGLTAVEKFHYNNDAWLARRMALCLKAQGHFTQAISEMNLILRRKNEWFIRKELAELMLETGEAREALVMAAEAMLMHGDLEYKIGLLYLMGCILMQLQDYPNAALHFQLSYLIREEQGWRIPDMLMHSMMSYREHLRPNITSEALLKELKPVWQAWAPNQASGDLQRLDGTIQKILHQNERGINGFIAYGDGQSIYFTMPPQQASVAALKEGTPVSFTIFLAKDPSKKPTAGKLKIFKQNLTAH